MIVDHSALRALSDVADARRDVASWQPLMLAMISDLTRLPPVLPDVGREALDGATSQWQRGSLDSQWLEDARVRIWEYMQAENGDSSSIVGDEDRALRAVLSVLYPPDHDDAEWIASDTVDWFVAMLEQIDGWPPPVSTSLRGTVSLQIPSETLC